MRTPKRMAVAISGLAFAGMTAVGLGAALPAGAQTVTATPQHSVSTQITGWGWDDGWGWDGWGCDWGDWGDCGC